MSTPLAALNIAPRIVRTKAMALLLAPAGFGLFDLYGLFGSILDLTASIVGMGINSSGVRQIAEAVGSGDKILLATPKASPAKAIADRPRSTGPSDAFAAAFSFVTVDLRQCFWRHAQCLE